MRSILIAAGVLVTASAWGQNPGWSPSWPTIDQKTLNQGTTMLRQAWKQVEVQGPKAAERVVREAPQHFKNIRYQTDRAIAQVNRWAKEKRLEERKNLAMELWRIRSSIDLLALIDSDVLQEITGIDRKTLKNLRLQIESAQAMLRIR